MTCHRRIFCYVKRKRSLSHTRSSRKHNKVGLLEAAEHFINISKSSCNTRKLSLVPHQLIYLEDIGLQHFLNRGVVLALRSLCY